MQDKSVLVIIFGVCISMVATLIGFIAFISFLYQKRQHAFFGQLQKVKNTYEREGLRSQLEVQEQTLRHISMEIHDNIGQFISLAKLHLNTLELPIGSAGAETVTSAVSLLSRAMDDLRDVSKSLSMEMIKTGGLVHAVESLLRQISKIARYVVNFEVEGSYDTIEEQKEIILFRILQEALNNVNRHAQATSVDIKLNFTHSQVTLIVNDNGRGFDTQNYWTTAGRSAHGGISHMTARASLINAKLLIDSVIGQGTRILVKVPHDI